MFITLALAVPSVTPGQIRSNAMYEEVLRLEKQFSHAIVKNDAEAVARFLADDWIIIVTRMEA
jgi:ketosteroid isomerase-like protein